MSKKSFKNPADEFLSAKPQNIEVPEDNINNNSNSNRTSNINNNSNSNRTSNINSIRISDIFDNIKENKTDGATRSFYLSNKIFNALAKKAKAKDISNSKFLEGILSQLFFGDD